MSQLLSQQKTLVIIVSLPLVFSSKSVSDEPQHVSCSYQRPNNYNHCLEPYLFKNYYGSRNSFFSFRYTMTIHHSFIMAACVETSLFFFLSKQTRVFVQLDLTWSLAYLSLSLSVYNGLVITGSTTTTPLFLVVNGKKNGLLFDESFSNSVPNVS